VELLEVTRHQELARSVENLSGSFNRKVVKGAAYWYYQFTESAGGGTRQIFVGPDNEKIRALVEKARTKDRSRLDALSKAATTLGCAATTPAHFRIVRRLNEIGFFRAGGVLVGTHAFLAYGNLLGVAWGDLGRTHDIDFAHSGSDIELALPASLTIGLEAPSRASSPASCHTGVRPGEETASFASKVDRNLRVDFLAPMVGGKSGVYRHENLGVNLQPFASRVRP